LPPCVAPGPAERSPRCVYERVIAMGRDRSRRQVACARCGSTELVLTGVRVPSASKRSGGSGKAERDYVLRCRRCWTKVVLPDLPEGSAGERGEPQG